MDRRRFNIGLAAAAAWLAVRTSAKAAPAGVLAEMNELARSLRAEDGDPERWADEMEALLADVELPDLTRRIDFEKVAAAMRLPEVGAGVARLSLPVVAGMNVKLFGLRKGRALVPHAHNEMVSMHLVVAGRIEGRHYDRVLDEADHLVVRPRAHEVYGPGGVSTVAPTRDNVHWFEARTEPAFAFGVAIPLASAARRRVFVDPERASTVAGDLQRMPIVSRRTAFARYGVRSP